MPMKRLPKTREVIAEVTKIASAVAEQEKTASANAAYPRYSTGVAQELVKMARALREVNPEAVTYEDVLSFGNELLRQP